MDRSRGCVGLPIFVMELSEKDRFEILFYGTIYDNDLWSCDTILMIPSDKDGGDADKEQQQQQQ